MGIFDKFKSGLGKSSSSLTDGFKNIFSKKKVDSTILEEFEELIISSDAGVDVAKELRKDFDIKVESIINLDSLIGFVEKDSHFKEHLSGLNEYRETWGA